MSIPVVTAPNLSHISGLLHGFTTRKSGNLQEGFGDNLERFATTVGVSHSKFRFVHQVHGSDVVLVGKEGWSNDLRPEGDALITAQTQIVLAIRVADCFPIILVDERNHALGIAHAGWRGTLARILPKTIGAMGDRFQTDPLDLKIAMGPGIGMKKLEVSKEIASLFADQLHVEPSRFLDLATLNAQLAAQAGVPAGQIWSSGSCTYCEPGHFFSYRREGNDAGRMIGFVGWSS